jgi:hypothetical protein
VDGNSYSFSTNHGCSESSSAFLFGRPTCGNDALPLATIKMSTLAYGYHSNLQAYDFLGHSLVATSLKDIVHLHPGLRQSGDAHRTSFDD